MKDQLPQVLCLLLLPLVLPLGLNQVPFIVLTFYNFQIVEGKLTFLMVILKCKLFEQGRTKSPMKLQIKVENIQ